MKQPIIHLTVSYQNISIIFNSKPFKISSSAKLFLFNKIQLGGGHKAPIPHRTVGTDHVHGPSRHPAAGVPHQKKLMYFWLIS